MRDVRSRRIASLVALAALGPLTFAGCGGGGGGSRVREPAPTIPFTQPDVALRNVQLRGLGITGGALDLDLRVANPNEYALESPRVAYRVFVGDVELADGVTDLDMTVAIGDSAMVHVPASVGYLSMTRAGRELMGTGVANYRVRGRITVGTPYGRVTFPYDRVGSFAPMRR